MAMRALGMAALLAVSGCSLLFNGDDLHGTSRGDLGPGADLAGADLAGADLTGGGDGGMTGGPCTPRTNGVKFKVLTPSTGAMGPYEVALSDIDHDGHLDLVTANYNANSFSVVLGDGQGDFTLATSTPIPSCDTPQMVLTRDLTGDGLDDVIISCFDDSGATPVAAVDVYVNASTPGTVKFGTAKPVALSTQLGLPYLATGFFNTGTNVDLAIVDPSDNQARIYLGDGQGGFGAPVFTLGTGKGGSWTSAGDLNGDGIDDLIIYNDTDGDMTMLLSKSDGTGFTPSTLAFDASTMAGSLAFVGNPPSLIDVDHDGKTDILVASGTSTPGTVEKFLNSGAATAPAFPSIPVDIDTGDFPIAQGFADFNCDGALDIAVSTNGCDPTGASCPGDVSQPPGLWVLTGPGFGFNPADATAIPLGTYNLVVADFNGDGYPDVATGSGTNNVTVLINMP